MTRLVAVLVLVLPLGCSNLNYQKAWKPTPPPESLTQRGTKVRFIDERPNWERKPFRDAIVLHALDDATPPVWTQLEGTISAATDELAERPERVEVTVRSIQLVAKDPVKLAEEAENQRKFRSEPDEDVGLPETFASILFAAPFELLLNAPFEKKYPPGLSESPDGTSCAIKADVTFTWPGGRTKTIPVSALATTDRPGESRDARVGLSEAVQLATFQMGEQLRTALGTSISP
jgi:hypothetical protein